MVASKLPQVLQLTPAHELEFQGPFDKVVTSFLELKNPSDRRICFKVKTTAPKRYCVRPNSGVIPPDGKTKIAIMLQPMEPESYNERSKHKFMVQSAYVSLGDESAGFDEIWSNASPETIMDSKLKCTFVEPDDKSKSGKPETSNYDPIPSLKKSTAGGDQATITTPQPNQASGDGAQMLMKRSTEAVTTSTPVSSRGTPSSQTASTYKDSEQTPGVGRTSSSPRRWTGQEDKSVLSSHNNSNSFSQITSDDKKMLIISLIMLILGVILGKYVI